MQNEISIESKLGAYNKDVYLSFSLKAKKKMSNAIYEKVTKALCDIEACVIFMQNNSDTKED